MYFKLFLYDLFITINVAALITAVADKIRRGSLTSLFWILTFAFGGLGSAVGCFFASHRTRNGEIYTALKLGLVQLVIIGVILHFLPGSIF